MPKSSRRIGVAVSIGLLAAVVGSASAQSNAGAPPAAKASALENFGFPYGFSVETMDRKADPRKDFRRYAAGLWLDAAIIPSDTVRISSIDVLGKRVEVQVGAVLDDAARASPAAAKGSPTQQVGDFYTAGMDEKRLTELGATPIKPEFDRIAAAEGRKGLTESLARISIVTNDAVFFSPGVSTDNNDRGRYAVFVVDADLPLGLDNYLKPEAQKIRDAYTKRIADSLVIAGSTPDEAAASAAKILAIKTRIAGRKLTPVEMRDPAKRFATMRYDEVKAMLGNVDLDPFFAAMGLPRVRRVAAPSAQPSEGQPQDRRLHAGAALLPHLGTGVGRQVQ